jgi:hypothetical protein
MEYSVCGSCSFQRVEQDSIVGAIDAWLDQDRPFNPETGEHLSVVGQEGVGRRVNAGGSIRVLGVWAADVRVVVAGARRQLNAGPVRIRIEGLAERGHQRQWQLSGFRILTRLFLPVRLWGRVVTLAGILST